MNPFRMQERDLDLFILEELHADTGFVEWLAESIGLTGALFLRAEHSVSAMADAKWGETDVLAFFRDGQDRVAVLVEDKIAASFQNRQAERYRERAQAIVAEGKAERYLTVLVAPTSYLHDVPANDPWDCRLAMETIADWFELRNGPHAEWRARSLRDCIARNSRILSPSAGAVSRFSAELADFLEHTPSQFSHARQRSDNSWGLIISFRGKAPYVSIVWKLNQSCVDLVLERQHVGKLQNAAELADAVFLPGRSTGFKSDMLRIPVGNASWSEPLSSQLDVVAGVLAACERLLPIALEIGSMPSVIQKAPELPAP